MNHKQLTDIDISNADGELLALLPHTRENMGSNILSRVQLQSATFATLSKWFQQMMKRKIKKVKDKFTSYPINCFTCSHPITRFYVNYISRIENQQKIQVI